jgi:multidrug efflux system membrane fusion protein
MRAFYSYGLAGLIILVIGAWLGTGMLVIGGHGPGNGERPVIALFEENGGPITEALNSSGLAAEHHESADGIDPHLTIAQRVAQAGGGAGSQARSVRTVTYVVQPMAIEVPLRGQTKAKASVNVMPETQGIIQQVHVDKGQRVAAGDLICTLDQGTRAAAVAQAEAALAQAQSAFDSNAELRSKGLAPANSGISLEANVKAAQAGVENAKAELARTEVRTKVAGVVQGPIATIGQFMSGQTACATVVELDPMLFVGSVPEARMGLARLGLEAKVTTVTGQSAEGKVTFLASSADSATRSFPVEIELPNSDGKILDGSTAQAVVNLGTAPAHLLPQSALTLDDEGVLGVRAVTADNTVAFYPITIMRDTREGIWVTGLPARVDVITVGQDFVQAGQKVNPTNVSEGAAAPAAEGQPT